MPTQTKSTTKSTTATRFGRTSAPATGRGRFARGTTTPRRRPLPSTALRRRKPQESTLQKALHAIVPAGAAKKAAPSTKKGKAGGVALAAAAAGMAFKNRDKLTRMVRKDEEPATGTTTVHDAQGNHVPPATP